MISAFLFGILEAIGQRCSLKKLLQKFLKILLKTSAMKSYI